MKRDEHARISHACHMRPGPGGVPLYKVKDVSEAITRGWTQDFFFAILALACIFQADSTTLNERAHAAPLSYRVAHPLPNLG